MTLSAGTRLGPYEILAPLGAGGMGEVYRAHDPRLKRDVALKVLPAELASEPERLERFEREAQTLAALNHPHIVTIHSVEEADDLHFLTMELVDGKTLTKVIPRGGLPLPRFFRIAIPLTEAVSAAHEKGVTHRDLKPGNVMVAAEDRVKILDFGLAKLRESVTGAMDSRSPTEPATGPGRILGTAPYMSPEQVQGQPVDHRSDVFSLGIILYEMVTGERPFAGDTFAEVASSILRETPRPVTERRADLPRDLARVVKRCLEKEPKRRIQSVLDLHNELEELKQEADSGALISAEQALRAGAPRRKRRWLWTVAALATLGMGVAGWWFLSGRAPGTPTEPIKIKPFTSDGGLKESPQLSPDGDKVAYSWTGAADDNWDIYVKPLGLGARALRVTTDPANDRYPAWSPDERQIAFVRGTNGDGAIYTVPSLGGQERKLIDISGLLVALNGYRVPVLSWSPDGDWLVFAEKASNDEAGRIVRLSLDTLGKQPLTSPGQGALGDLYPALSPDGTQLAFVRGSGGTFGDLDVWVQPVAGGEARRVTLMEYDWTAGLTWTPDGQGLVASDWEGSFRVSLADGEPRPVLGLGRLARQASIRGSRLVYAQAVQPDTDLWRVPGRSGLPDRAPEKLIGSSAWDRHPAYSPDGRRIAFSSSRTGESNIWLCDSDGSNPVQLTSFEAHTGTPNWSPDSQRLVFDSVEAGDWNIYVIDADGGGPRRLTQEASTDVTGAWSHDGEWVFFESDRSGSRQIWKIPSEGGQAVQVTQGGGQGPPAAFWDGRYLYYSRLGSTSGIWRVPVDGGEETEVVRGRINGQGWDLGRSGIYYAMEEPSLSARAYEYAIQYLDFESGQVSELFRKEEPAYHGGLTVSPDEEWVLFEEKPVNQSELMLMENFR